MKNNSLSLYLEINLIKFIFLVGENDEQNNCKIINKIEIPLEGIRDNRISDSEKAFQTIKENIYLIEQKLNYTFREIILILDYLKPSFINMTGFKKLNGSQVLRENITYILNNLKAGLNEVETKKTILHIFNSKFSLDKKKIENLPIGLFGDFYSHELSFILINSNEYKNLESIFDKCSLKIRKIFVKSFINGALISERYKNCDTFFQIKIGKNNSKIFYFENNSLKFEQVFKFGTDIIIKDISKIISLDIELVKILLNEIELNEDIQESELIEEKFFANNNFRKIKKKLVYEIATARIREISELLLFKNINFRLYKNYSDNIFLEIDRDQQFKGLEKIFEDIFSRKKNLNLRITDSISSENALKVANKLVHFGWKKEAIPITQTKKSLIGKLFEALFN